MKRLMKPLAIVFIVAFLVQACGSSRTACKTRGKTRTEMGYM